MEARIRRRFREASVASHTARLLEFELAEARDLQRALLSPPPSIDGYDFDALYRPAQFVGGIYYDFILRPEGRLLMVLGDVSASGLAGCFRMVELRAAVRKAAAVFSSPSRVLYAARNIMLGVFGATANFEAVAALLTPQVDELTVACVGRQPLIKWSWCSGNCFVYQREDLDHDEVTVPLAAGDRFALCTSGLALEGRGGLADFLMHNACLPSSEVVAFLDEQIEERGDCSADVAFVTGRLTPEVPAVEQ